MLATESPVIEKAKNLCDAIVEDTQFQGLHKDVENFLADDSARDAYRAVHEKGAELQDKQRIGVELTAQEMTDFELSREELFQNQKVVAFMEAQQQLQSLQKLVNDYLGMTIENGKVPTEQEIMEAQSGGGCCGGSGGGGCGC